MTKIIFNPRPVWPSGIVVACSCLIDLYLQGHIYLQSKNMTPFQLNHMTTHHPFNLEPPNLAQMCKIPWLRSILFGGWLNLACQIEVIFKILFIYIAFASLKHLLNLRERMKTESIAHPTWLLTYMFAHRVASWIVEQSSCLFSVTIAVFPVLDSAIGDGYVNASVGFR